MTLRYSIRIEDYDAYADWNSRNDPKTVKYWQRITTRTMVGAALVFAANAYFFPRLTWAVPVMLAILFPIMRYAMPNHYRHQHAKAMRNYHLWQQNAGLVGKDGIERKSMEVSADGIMVVNEKITSLHRWDLTDRIETTEDFAFFIGKLGVMILPRTRVTEGNFEDFVAEAQRLHAEANGVKMLEPLPAR